MSSTQWMVTILFTAMIELVLGFNRLKERAFRESEWEKQSRSLNRLIAALEDQIDLEREQTANSKRETQVIKKENNQLKTHLAEVRRSRNLMEGMIVPNCSIISMEVLNN